MSKLFTLVMIVLALSGCGRKGDTGPAGTPGVTVEVDTPPAPDAATQLLVDSVNRSRVSLGQAILTQGLTCTVQALQSGSWLSNTSPGYQVGQGVVVVTVGSTAYNYLMTGAFNQPDSPGGTLNSLLPTPLQSTFVALNYRIVCTGQIVTTQAGYYQFELNSDDASILTIDGTQVINNDGSHAMSLKLGIRNLTEGVHTFSMQYAQTGGGNFGLTLKANGDVVPGFAFYH